MGSEYESKDPYGVKIYLPKYGLVDVSEITPHDYPSTCVGKHDYNVETQELTIEFVGPPHGGSGTYLYENVPLNEYVLFNNSSSRGTYFNLYIRDRYNAYRVS